MSQIVAPSANYEATFETAISGLVGTIALGTYDGDTATQALATTGINEIGTTGIYVATRTAPGTGGQYVLVWSLDGTLDPDQVATEDLLVTSEEVSAVGGTSNLYISSAELKASGSLAGTTFRDDDVALAVAAASRAIDGYKGTRYYSTTEERFYSPDRFGDEVFLNDLVTVASVTVDVDGDGTYGTTWVEGTDFYLDPANASLEGLPSRSLILRSQANRRFPRYGRSLKVVGDFGWAETPVLVKQAAKILATRLLKRVDTPFGILTLAAGDAVAAARLGRIDPDVAFLLDQVPPFADTGFTSVQLG